MESSIKRSTSVTLLTFAVLLLMCFSLLQRYFGHVMSEPDTDFLVYYFEAAAVHDHPRAPMYTPALTGNPQLRWAPPNSEVYQRAEAAGFNGTNLYLYPPLLADMLLPIVHLGPHHAAALWRVANLLLVLLSVGLLLRFVGIQFRTVEAAVVLGCAYAFWPVHETVSQGQISIVLLGLWTLGMVCYANGKLALSAIAFAFAAWLKVTPVLLLLVMLMWRDWRWLRTYLLTGLALSLLIVRYNGLTNMLDSFQVLRNMSGSLPALGNKCISGMFWWWRLGHPTTIPMARAAINAPTPGIFLAVCKLLSAAYLLTCLLLVWRRRNSGSRVERALTLATFAVVLPLVSPVSWRHGYTASLLLLIILWVVTLRTAVAPAIRVYLLTFTTASVGSLCFDLAAQAPLPGFLSVILASAWPVSCMFLCLEVLWHPPSPNLVVQPSNAAVLPV